MSTTDGSTEFLSLQSVVAGRYSLEREIGRGGMGIVFLARDVALDRPVAIKLLPPALAADSAFRHRFVQEARTAAGLSHPNIVPIHAVEEHDDLVFFVMTLVEGETLRERVDRRGPLRPSEAVRLIQEVAWALTLAHAKGIVHRDVKPDNILIEKATGRAMVTDFGIARIAEVKQLTGAGEVVGTAHYMSPEQACGEKVDPRSDIYSLGVTAFFALTGQLPFDASSVAGLLAMHLTQPAPPVASVQPKLPTKLAAAVDRCLVKEPNTRFQSGEELAEAIGEARDRVPEVPPAIRYLFSTATGLGIASGVFLFAANVTTDRVVVGVLAMAWLAYLFGLLGQARGVLERGFTVDDVIAAASREVRDVDGVRHDHREVVRWWLRIWARPLGTWFFKLAGIGLRKVVPVASPTTEPTEVVLAKAADAVFDGLPAQHRKRFSDVPGVIHRLQKHAEALRKRRGQLERALAQASVAQRRPSAEVGAHASPTAAELNASAQVVGERLATAVAALESLRLDLMRFRSDEGSINDLTADLEAAREISEEIDRLFEGQREVPDMLESEETIPR